LQYSNFGASVKSDRSFIFEVLMLTIAYIVDP